MHHKVEPVGKLDDPRGENYVIKDVDKEWEVSVQRTRAGKARGAHSHQAEEEFYVISGKALFLSRTVEDVLKVPVLYSKRETIKTVPNEPHLIWAIEDLVLSGSRPNGFEATPDPIFMKIMDAINGESSPPPKGNSGK